MRIYGQSPDLLICRHGPGDSDCSKNGGGYVREVAQENERKLQAQKQQIARLERELVDARTPSPDAHSYLVEEAERVGRHLVMRVKYPN